MKKILFVFFAGLLLLSCGCGFIAQLKKWGGGGSEITVKKLVPAEVDVSKYKKIGVFDFEGSGGKDVAEWLEIALQNVRIEDRPFFEVITRSKLMRLLQEQRLGLTPFIDPDKAAKIGKISGVQAIVTGRVSAFVFQDKHYSKQVTRIRNNRSVKENVPCNGRSAYVDFTVNFLDAQTGQIMASSSADGQTVAEYCQGGDELSELFSKLITDVMFQSIQRRSDNIKKVPMDIQPRMLKEAAYLSIDKFVKKISPTYQLVPVVILEGDYSGFSGAFKEKPESEKLVQGYYMVGYKYGIRGQWEDAVKQWEKVLEIDPLRPAAIYNIGIAFEMTGDLFLAEKQFKSAVDMRPEDLFFDALTRVRNSISERKKIAQQLGRAPVQQNNQPPSAQERLPVPEQKKSDEQKSSSSSGEKEKDLASQSPKIPPAPKIKNKSGSAHPKKKKKELPAKKKTPPKQEESKKVSPM